MRHINLSKGQEARIIAEHDIRIELKKEGKVYINLSLRQLKIYNLSYGIRNSFKV